MSADDPTIVPAPAPAPPARMSPLAKLGIAAAVVALLVLGAWAYGRSSTAPDRAAADATRLRAMLLESRTQVLDAQLSLHAANFGNAAQHLEYAKPPLAAASSALRDQDLRRPRHQGRRRAAAGDDGARPRRQAQPRRQQPRRRGLEAARGSPLGPAALIAATSGSSPSPGRCTSRPVSASPPSSHDDRLAAVEDDAVRPRASRCRSSGCSPPPACDLVDVREVQLHARPRPCRLGRMRGVASTLMPTSR